MYWKSSLLLEIEARMLLTLRIGRLFQWEAQLLVAFFVLIGREKTPLIYYTYICGLGMSAWFYKNL